MVVTNTRGLRDWIIQRITAIIIGIYSIFLLAYIACHPAVTFTDWSLLFHHNAVRFFTLLTALSIVWHAWIGIWTVLTDYVKPKNLRLFLEILVFVMLLACIIWVIAILWR